MWPGRWSSPSQLYEAGLEGLLLFIVLATLIFRFGKLKTPGYVGGSWVVGYAVSRIIVEFFRQPDAHIGYLAGDWLTMGMILSLPMLAIGLWGILTASSRKPWHSDGDDGGDGSKPVS
jgi:phosphatidylglycerol:prolipoprotein diacylglycerol transferase